MMAEGCIPPPQPAAVYPPSNPSYAPPRYPVQQGGYRAHRPGYPFHQPGYPLQPGYPVILPHIKNSLSSF